MAFVFRSERKILNFLNSPNENNMENENNINSNILFQVKSQENILKDSNLFNNRYNNLINSPSPPFLTGVERNKYNKNEDFPGPGKYNISKGYYNKHRQFSSRQENSKPEEYELFDLPLLRMKEVVNDNPGPGQYNPNEKELFGGKFRKRKKEILIRNNSLLNNISQSSIKRETQENKNLEIGKNINNLICIYSSKRRKTDKEDNLEKKSNYGELSENYSMKNIKSSLSISSETEKKLKNNLKINNNNNNSKISGITLDTERTSKNISRLSLSQIRNKSSKLFQNLKNQLKSNNQDKCLYNYIVTDVGINNNILPLKNDKSRIYRNEQNHDRLLFLKESNPNYNKNITDFEKYLNSEYFFQNPGPGYYDPIDLKFQNYYKPKKNINTFKKSNGQNVTSLFNIKKGKASSFMPDEFKLFNNITENDIKNKQNKKIRDILFDVKKISKLRIIREKEALKRNENNKLLKENNYYDPIYGNNSKEIYEENPIEYRKIHEPNNLLFNFGSNEKRFLNLKKNFNLGPGEYDVNLYKSIEQKNSNLSQNPNYQELFNRAENKNNLLERASLNKDLINNPAVGQYNPDIISSIEYNSEYKYKYRPPIIHKSYFNPQVEEETILKAKEIKEKEKKLISFLGPGKYLNMINENFINLNKNKDKGRPPFGSSQSKSEIKKKELYPGPGQYDINSYYNWITRTFNNLFC